MLIQNNNENTSYIINMLDPDGLTVLKENLGNALINFLRLNLLAKASKSLLATKSDQEVIKNHD